jgi:hypothetical protein
MWHSREAHTPHKKAIPQRRLTRELWHRSQLNGIARWTYKSFALSALSQLKRSMQSWQIYMAAVRDCWGELLKEPRACLFIYRALFAVNTRAAAALL